MHHRTEGSLHDNSPWVTTLLEVIFVAVSRALLANGQEHIKPLACPFAGLLVDRFDSLKKKKKKKALSFLRITVMVDQDYNSSHLPAACGWFTN